MLFFMPGSQGRFLASVFWALVDNQKIKNSPKELNAWHGETGPGDYISTVTNLKNYTSPTFYHDLVWNHQNGNALFRSHYYPDWEQLASLDKFKNTKFIVIHIDLADLTECLANEMYKNTYKSIKGLDKTIPNNNAETLYRLYEERFGATSYEEFVEKIDSDFVQSIVSESSKTYLNFLQTKHDEENRINYIFTEIPNYIADRTLVINFRDLYTKSKSNYGWVALDKLISLTGIVPSEEVLDNIRYNFSMNYKKRRAFIRDYMYKLDITL